MCPSARANPGWLHGPRLARILAGYRVVRWRENMSAPIVHFEIGSKNSAELSKFYAAVLGWKFQPAGAVAVVDNGGAGGPSGMLNALGHPPDNYVILYAEVSDIEA